MGTGTSNPGREQGLLRRVTLEKGSRSVLCGKSGVEMRSRSILGRGKHMENEEHKVLRSICAVVLHGNTLGYTEGGGRG